MSTILFLSVYFDIVYILIVKAFTLITEGSMALQEMAYRLVNVPVHLAKRAFRIQMEILYLPIRLINNFYRLIFKGKEAVRDRNISVKPSSIKQPNPHKSVQVSSENRPCDKFVQVDSEEKYCNKFVQVNSDEKPCDKSVQVNSDSEQGLFCNKSVQVVTDSIEELPCNKFVQVSEKEFPCDKSVQTVCDSGNEFPFDKSVQTAYDSRKEFPSDKSVQTVSDSETKFPSHKSVQTIYDSQQEYPSNMSVQTTSDSDYEISCDRSIEPNVDLQNKTLTKNFAFNTEDIDMNNTKISSITEIHPVCVTSSDYIKYSELVKEQTVKIIEELSNITNSMSSSNETVRALRSLQYLQAKREKVNKNFKSMQNEIITEAIPAIKQKFCAMNLQRKNIEEIKNTKVSKTKSDLVQNDQSFETFTIPSEDIRRGHLVLVLSVEVLSSLVDIITQEVISLKGRLTATNNKMDEVLKSSDSLFKEQSVLNERFGKLVDLSSKISDLQNALGESNCKALSEVAADRDEMLLKLVALERIIKEEEEYLDDVSCESGYEELENRIASQCSSLG